MLCLSVGSITCTTSSFSTKDKGFSIEGAAFCSGNIVSAPSLCNMSAMRSLDREPGQRLGRSASVARSPEFLASLSAGLSRRGQMRRLDYFGLRLEITSPSYRFLTTGTSQGGARILVKLTLTGMCAGEGSFADRLPDLFRTRELAPGEP